MARFEPFAGIRYDPDRVSLTDVVAPPYDVIGAEERARLEQRSPYNVVHVDLAREEGTRDRYVAAGCRFDEWTAEGVLAADPEPAFYLYRMGWHGDGGELQQTSGVIGALQLDAGGTGAVLPHERTMAKPLDDRLRLMRSCHANLSPIWGVSAAAGLGALLEPTGPPAARVTDDDGVHHRIWPVTAPAVVEAIGRAVSSHPVVIADGHHRYETALAYQAERRAANADTPGPHDLVMALVTPLEDGNVGVRPIHRLLSGLADPATLVDALSSSFDLQAVPPPADGDALLARMDDEGGLAAVTPAGVFLLRPLDSGSGAASTVDSERLEAALTSLPAHDVAYHHDADHALALVDKGEAQAAILLRPTTVAQISAAAAAGRRLPQKSTFFYPKPRTGLVFRTLS